jgi:ornithine carbamoyltransferase
MRHFITLEGMTSSEINRIFSISEDLKTKFTEGIREPILPGRVLALLFEKQSLRTRVSFEAGMTHLGGSSMYLGADVGFGKRESVADFGRVLSEMVDAVVVRSKSHKTLTDLAEHCTCSVINGLTDQSHPCQTLADLFTIREIFGSLEGRTVAWVGDGNNVARSLALGCSKVGMKMTMATPDGYRFDDEFLATLKAESPQFDLEVTSDPIEAVRDAVAVYTDVWASMGQEAEQKQREQDFAPFQVNEKLMSNTQKGSIFLHCLPARRGEEVTDQVMESDQSAVFQQAGNRMHIQKGILAWLLGSHAK